MKKTLAILAVVAAAGIAAAPAHASQRYVSAAAGISWFQDSDINGVYQRSTATPDVISFDAGFTGVAAVGCDYGSTRAELELGYQRNTIKDSTDGKVQVYSIMANGFYDIPVGSKVELYGMAGAGVARVNLQGSHTCNYGYERQQSVTWNYNTEETAFAYQLGAGLAVPVSKGVMLDARYRYFATMDFTFPSQGFHSEEVRTNVSSHSVLLGLRVDI
ncbi:MAG: porin family protein [Chlorobium sp.]|nr:MAG: porin family protein [Chlorobium sp.]